MMQGVFRGFSLVCCLIGLLALPVPVPVLSAADQAQESVPALRLEDLERRALDQSPALRQAAARVRAATGRTTQAGLYPNPVIGYNGDEISRGPVIRGGEHGVFVEQPLVMSGRLGVNRRMFGHEQQQAEATAEAQQYRVLNTVRLLYYQALGAERLVQVRADLARIAHEAVEISEQLYNIGQADRPDVIEAEVEAERVDLALTQARQRREAVWWWLAEAVGDPLLRRTPLAGSLEDSIPPFDQEQVLQALVRDSPEIKMARAGVARSDAALTYARVERIPDLVVRGGLRYNRELLERGGQPVGLEGFADAGIRLPLFDRNQGSIAAARADIDRAEHEVKRVQLSLQARLAVAFNEYRVAQDAVSRYRNTILPRARQAYELYRNKFQQMAAAYPQVLIAQRNLFQLEDEYVAAQVNLWRTVVAIRGFLLVEGFEGRGGSEEGRMKSEE